MPDNYLSGPDILTDPRFAAASLPKKMEALNKVGAYNDGVLAGELTDSAGPRQDLPAKTIFDKVQQISSREAQLRSSVMADHVASRAYDVASANDQDPAATLEKIQSYVAGDKSIALSPDEMDAANEWIAASEVSQQRERATSYGSGRPSIFAIDTPGGATVGGGQTFRLGGKDYNYLAFDSNAEGQPEQDPTKRFHAIVPATKSWEVANKELTDQISQRTAEIARLEAGSKTDLL